MISKKAKNTLMKATIHQEFHQSELKKSYEKGMIAMFQEMDQTFYHMKKKLSHTTETLKPQNIEVIVKMNVHKHNYDTKTTKIFEIFSDEKYLSKLTSLCETKLDLLHKFNEFWNQHFTTTSQIKSLMSIKKITIFIIVNEPLFKRS